MRWKCTCPSVPPTPPPSPLPLHLSQPESKGETGAFALYIRESGGCGREPVCSFRRLFFADTGLQNLDGERSSSCHVSVAIIGLLELVNAGPGST